MKNIVQAHDLKFRLLLTEQQIQTRLKEIGAQLNHKFQSDCPLFLGILNGAFMMTADLVRYCEMDCETSFIKLSSYAGTNSTGEVAQLIGLSEDVKDRHVILVEDIVDTGRTMHTFIPDLKKLEPASITLVTLLLKPDALENEVEIDCIGFEIPNLFVIGYGLDYDGLGRNLRSIYQKVDDEL